MDEQLIKKHFLVPEHIKLSAEEKNNFLNERNLAVKQLPAIKKTDAAIQNLSLEVGDIIKILRKSETTGESEFYRVVVSG